MLKEIINNDVFNNEIDLYYDGLLEYCKMYGLRIEDIFYWEQRMGIWGGWYPMEQDIAIEEFSPFNSRELIEIFLSYRKYKKLNDGSQIFIDIIKYNWPELTKYKINPRTSMRYLRKIKSILQK